MIFGDFKIELSWLPTWTFHFPILLSSYFLFLLHLHVLLHSQQKLPIGLTFSDLSSSTSSFSFLATSFFNCSFSINKISNFLVSSFKFACNCCNCRTNRRKVLYSESIINCIHDLRSPEFSCFSQINSNFFDASGIQTEKM